MPDKIIQIDGVGNVAFPDSMSDDDISQVIKKQHEPLTWVEKTRNFLMRGTTEGPGHYEPPGPDKQFDFPQPIKTAGMVLGGLEAGVGMASRVAPAVASAAAEAAPEGAGIISRILNHPKVRKAVSDAFIDLIPGARTVKNAIGAAKTVGQVAEDVMGEAAPAPPKPMDTANGQEVFPVEPEGHFASRPVRSAPLSDPISIEQGWAARDAARKAKVAQIQQQVNWSPQSPVNTAAVPVQPQVQTIPFANTERDAAIGAAKETAARTGKADSVAKHLAESGIKYEDLQRLAPEDLQQHMGAIAKDVLGLNKTGQYSLQSVKQTMQQLKMLENPAASPQMVETLKSRNALGIAADLAKELAK